MDDKGKQTPRTVPQAVKPEVYGPYNRADLDHDTTVRINTEERARPVRKRVRTRDDGYER